MATNLRTRPISTSTQTTNKLSRANRQRIAQIKRLIATPFDNINHPVPLYQQLRTDQ